MALLVDKHRPRSLEALSYHQGLSERLKALVSCIPHYPAPLFRKDLSNSLPLQIITGTKWRLPPPPPLRPLRRRQKNPHPLSPQVALRPRCREDQDRLARLPNDFEPETRVQYRIIDLPPRDHAVGRGELRPSRGAGAAEGGGADAAGRSGRETAVQGCGRE